MKKGNFGNSVENQIVTKEAVTFSGNQKQLSEDAIQNKCYIWFNNTYCLKFQNPRYVIFSVPNGGSRNVVEAIKLKNTGVLSGVSDLIIILDRRVLFIELKDYRGRQSENQKDFEARVKNLNHVYRVANSLESFQEIVKEEIAKSLEYLKWYEKFILYVKEKLK